MRRKFIVGQRDSQSTENIILVGVGAGRDQPGLLSADFEPIQAENHIKGQQLCRMLERAYYLGRHDKQEEFHRVLNGEQPRAPNR
jgi:hypothetical protein